MYRVSPKGEHFLLKLSWIIVPPLLPTRYTYCSSAKTLLISYVGMQTQEVAVAPSLRVILKSDSEILDEVTVIAYGTAKKNSLRGSVATIKCSDMEKLPVN